MQAVVPTKNRKITIPNGILLKPMEHVSELNKIKYALHNLADT